MHDLCQLLLSADIPAAGRFDKDSIPQQTAMEILCANFDNLEQVHDPNGEFLPIQHWRGLKFDADANIIEINFDSKITCNLFPSSDEEEEADPSPPVGPGGSIDLQWIPSTVLSFSLCDVEASGSVDTSSLPRKLEKLDISFNEFRGECRMAGLPSH